MTLVDEERAARDRHAHMERMQAGAARARETATARAIREAAAETRVKHKTCRCNFTGVKTKEQLLAMGAGCTDPVYACPRLTAVRFKVGAWT